MIPFFRKIRKQLADDNRPLKYFRYALGEILLVVIGILIALQINNWNEARKLAKSEKSYYFSLRSDLQKDSLDYVRKISNAQRNIVKLNNILSFIESDYRIKKSQISNIEWRNKNYSDTLALIHCLSQAGFMQFPVTYNNTITDLRSTGNLKLLKNEKLRDELLSYYNWAKLYESWSEVFLVKRLDIESTVDGILDKDSRVAYTKDDEMGLENIPFDYKVFLDKIKTKKKLREQTIGMLHIQSRIVLQGNIGLERVKTLINSLSEEL